MHRAGSFITALAGGNPTKTSISGLVLSAPQAANLSQALRDDAQDYYYSECLSFVDGIRGGVARFYTWATVKMYYSVFYSLRAMLAVDGVCVFYVGSTPYWIEAKAGGYAHKSKGTTHCVVLNLFEELNLNHRLLSQDIAFKPPLEWLRERREECNYTLPRFSEPESPQHFEAISDCGTRRLLTAYIADTSDLYTFDDSHAVMAYALAALMHVGRALASSHGGAAIDDEEMAFLESECKDLDGRIAPLTNFITEIRV